MTNQIFLFLVIIVISSIAEKRLPDPNKVEDELMAAGMNDKYISKFIDFQIRHYTDMDKAEEEEKKTGKKGLQDAVLKRDAEKMKKMQSSWPEREKDILAEYLKKALN
ncbi:unnamed protein product [Caenorhabditis brenneri]